ncbi:hypothetical protein J1N35_012601 [Gossypium stocksii]|uniref:Uncharacterized protein n=1 Tax=Gossypium stocksii TaxID=47602 RepID=A0A9D3W5G1_9ROSI|nr:hypothetical protein J1N35_012601 [Gossypium stocksii]
MKVKQSATVLKKRAFEVVVAQVKPLEVVKLKEAVVCKERATKATLTKMDADYMTSHVVAFHSLP